MTSTGLVPSSAATLSANAYRAGACSRLTVSIRRRALRLGPSRGRSSHATASSTTPMTCSGQPFTNSIATPATTSASVTRCTSVASA
jgi:hypothetical protein